MTQFPTHEIRRHNGGRRSAESAADPGNPLVLAHLSDPHIAGAGAIDWHDLVGKRILGYLRWKLLRRSEHRLSLLTRLRLDLSRTRPDHIVVTGDLTRLGLPVEFDKARRWLAELGPPDRVTVVPGNHDAYVRTDWHETFAGWLAYMVSDPPHRQNSPTGSLNDLFPTLRVRGPIALIGVSTAHPSAPHLAVGGMGVDQLERLAVLLKLTAGCGLFRIVFIHHPPISGIVSRRRHLTDRFPLQRVIYRFGTELILHGHAHRTTHHFLKTRFGPVPVMGAPSITSLGRTRQRRAGYRLYTITPFGKGWNVGIAQRTYSIADNGFVSGGKQRFHAPATAV